MLFLFREGDTMKRVFGGGTKIHEIVCQEESIAILD